MNKVLVEITYRLPDQPEIGFSELIIAILRRFYDLKFVHDLP